MSELIKELADKLTWFEKHCQNLESKLAEAQAEKVYANGKLSEAMVKLNELREMLKGSEG